jgi:hypothetical protein
MADCSSPGSARSHLDRASGEGAREFRAGELGLIGQHEAAGVQVPLSGRRYKLGSEFPAEGFVQQAIEDFFSKRGFDLDTRRNVDLICVEPTTGERWHIEAKGVTSQCGLDFKTCLGQLLLGMEEPSTTYAVAIPDDPRYLLQVAKVSSWVVDRLGVHWLIVAKDGSIKVVSPKYLTIVDQR